MASSSREQPSSRPSRGSKRSSSAEKTVIKARRLGTVRYLTPEELELSRRPRGIEETFSPGPATTAEKEARREVADFVQRGYRQRLLTSTEGSFSAATGDDEFVITSFGVDRATASPENLTLVRRGRQESGKQASRAASIHREIYRKWPEFRAIVNAMPVNATAFAVTNHPLDARTIPESYLFLRDVGSIKFGMQFSSPGRIAEAVSPDRPVALIENDGVLVAGRNVLDAFDRLEVLEATAEAIINARGVGQLRPMDNASIEQLIDTFLKK